MSATFRRPITGISSMATRALLADLARDYETEQAQPVAIESVGGVDAARRVQAGEAFDVVILASDAIARLLEAGPLLVAGSVVDLVRSEVVAAVPAGTRRPDLSTEAGLRRAVMAARRIGYSTGPSGTQLLRLFERWGVMNELQGRLVQAPPGVPVGALIARREVDIGFQQASELLGVDGIEVAGALPAPVQIVTVFSGAVATTSSRPVEAAAFLAFLASPQAAAAKQRHGMSSA